MNKKIIQIFSLGLTVIGLSFVSVKVYATLVDNQITACVKPGGILHLIGDDFKKQDCGKKEKIVAWNIQGEKGEKGDQGLPGASNWDEARIVALEARVAALENPSPSPTPTTTPACTTILCENFNSYIDGSIVGQGGWIDRQEGTKFIVEGTVVNEGTKALYSNTNSATESIVTKNTGNTLTDGKQSFYVRTENRSSWEDYRSGQNVQFGVYQNSWDGPARAVLTFMKDGHVTYIDNTGYVNFDIYNDNAWNLAEIEWRNSDKSARFRVNSGTWTNWIPFTGGSSFTGFNTVGIGATLLGTGGVYIDNFK